MKKDLIIGCYTNYDWDKIKFWVNSIDASGFTGDKAMVIYNSDVQTAQMVANKGFKIFGFNQDPVTGNLSYPGQLIVVVQRFLDLYRFTGTMDLSQYRYIIHTDVKDVVFQTNPSDWLTENMGDAKILASCESLRYRDEPWGNENMANSFPMVYETIKDQPIWNCGVQAGDPIALRDLWLNIYLASVGSQATSRVYNPDQAAYNVLMNMDAYRSMARYAMSEDGWACQAGTTIDPAKIADFKPHLIEPQPIWKDGYACTSTGVRHAILHQYDRVPGWRSVVEGRYS